jgi:hypothetical protein
MPFLRPIGLPVMNVMVTFWTDEDVPICLAGDPLAVVTTFKPMSFEFFSHVKSLLADEKVVDSRPDNNRIG